MERERERVAATLRVIPRDGNHCMSKKSRSFVNLFHELDIGRFSERNVPCNQRRKIVKPRNFSK